MHAVVRLAATSPDQSGELVMVKEISEEDYCKPKGPVSNQQH